MIPFASVNWLAVIVGTVVSMILGALWYGPLFGNMWLRLIGRKAEELEANPLDYLKTAVAAFVAMLFLNMVVVSFGAQSFLGGLLVGALVYIGFALAISIWQVWLLFACYGIYYGVVEGVARAFVADLVPEEKRGTAYGLYHGVVGLTLLPASLIAGWLWATVSPAAPFYFGASLAFAAMLGIMALIKE